jgi:lipopolysaccharide export system protein LptA
LESIQTESPKKQPRLVESVASTPAVPEAESLPSAAAFMEQSGVSQAALLGTTTTGYLLKDAPSSKDAQRANVFNPLAKAVEPKETLNDKVDTIKAAWERRRVGRQQSEGAVALPTPIPSIAMPSAHAQTTQTTHKKPAFTVHRSLDASAVLDTSQSVVYSFSGTTYSAPMTREAALMSGLSDAIVLDEFAQETLAQEEAGAPGKPGLSIHAQASDQTPLLLPIPTLDQPAGNPVPLPPPNQAPVQPEAPPTQAPPTQAPAQTVPTQPPQPTAPTNGTTPGVGSVIELTADRQEYDEQRKIFTAEGKVLMRFQGALLDADRVQVNLDNRLAVAEGNVALTRGTQVLRGQRLEYSFVQGVGTLLNARGEISLADASTDLGVGTRNEGVTIARPVSDRITAAQPTQNVNSPGSLGVGLGFGRDISRVPGGVPRGGQVRRLRFEADRIDFTPDGWVAKNIQITNDPFSPPELVLKSEEATLTRVSPLRDEVRTKRPRLVFDQRFTLPFFLPVFALDRRQRSPALFEFGYDDEDRGGLFVGRTFNVLSSNTVRFTLTPQIFLQRAITNGGNPFKAENFGFQAALNVTPGPLTDVRGKVSFTSLDFSDLENNVRASLRARQLVGTHTLALEYSYRDRLFNGSLGFQTVQSSLGAVLLSPRILLGKSGIELTYQTGFQYVNADTDRLDLLSANRTNNRISLGRFEATVQLSRGFTLWRGTALPPTPEEGLRYSPIPLVPYVSLGVSLRGVTSAYTSGDTQNNLIASVGLGGQFGHFSRKFFDYTAFNISYTQYIGGGQSPFLFDRTVDTRVLSLGITQQLYGPFRIGFQTSINLDSSNQFSTDYILEYSRRTYAIVLRYNPVLSIGAIGLRISDFNWTGGTDTFENSDITPVEGGVILRRDE